MPARKSTATSSGASSPLAREEYNKKREKNNAAVKKTRQKSKRTADERRQRVETLKTENKQLEAKIEEKKNNIKTLKDLLLSPVQPEERKQMIQDMLQELSDDEDN